MTKNNNRVRVLEIKLSDVLVGYLTGYPDGKNVFHFAHEYIQSEEARPTLTLRYYRKSEDVFRNPMTSHVRLPSFFSNLLPERDLREWIAQQLKISPNREFDLLAATGRDLPGAVLSRELTAREIPPYALEGHPSLPAHTQTHRTHLLDDKFSLSGVFMKFSMVEKNGKFFMSRSKNLGNWIIKIPSMRYLDVPLNEYTCMVLAKSAGIQIPEIRLVEMKHIQDLPEIKITDEKFAYAIQRFDRDDKKRIHAEDFAQVFDLPVDQKYGKTNYDTMARTINGQFPDSLWSLQEFFSRLAVNIMIGNGDAHLKNWTVLYPNKEDPILSSAYDILFTRAYVPGDETIALNLAKEKRFTHLTLSHFERMAKRADIDWRLIQKRVTETIDLARSKWPTLLRELPMNDLHKKELKEHWKRLTADFRVVT